MTRFPSAGLLASWTKLCFRTIQCGSKNRAGKTGRGNPYLKGILGEAAAAKTATFVGERPLMTRGRFAREPASAVIIRVKTGVVLDQIGSCHNFEPPPVG
jgi:transposase